MDKSTFCILPWIHLFASTTGTLRPCCVSKEFDHRYKIHKEGIEGYWNSQEMRELRQAMLSGEKPNICNTCWDKEENGDKHSKRIGELTAWSNKIDVDNLIASTADDGTAPDNIVSFDLRLGNLCNLKCVMCNPNSSSKWHEDKEILNKYENTFFSEYSLPNLKWPEQDHLWNYLNENAENIRAIQFAGGEPLLHKKHHELLRFLVDNDYSKDVFLKYNTNITVIPDVVLDLWENFKRVDIWSSIDGVGKLNDYIRYPSKWETIVANLDLLDKTSSHLNVRVNCTVSALNIEHVCDLMDFIVDRGYSKIGKTSWFTGVHIAPDLVYDPRHLNVRVLPLKDKERITAKVKKYLETVENEQFCNQMNYVLTYMNAEDWSDDYQLLLKYVDELDSIRKMRYPYDLPSKG